MNKKLVKKWELEFAEIKRKHDEIYKENFFDVQIDCGSIILPAHRYVMSSSSTFLAEQIASGVNKLNWTEFDEKTCIALLRWIYTNEVAFSFSVDVTAVQWVDLLHASYKLHLVDLFTICEEKLLSLLNDGLHRIMSRFRRLYDVSKKVGSNRLMQKCFELRLNVPDDAQEELEVKIAEVDADFNCSGSVSTSEQDDQVADEEFDELLLLNKLTVGYHEFRQFSDTDVIMGNNLWGAHAHVLDSRSKKILKEVVPTIGKTGRVIRRICFHRIYGIEHKFLRWIYTDCVVFEKDYFATTLLRASQFYELRALFERCEDALVGQVDIASCAGMHNTAEELNATKLLKRCNELISQYFNKTKSPDCSEMDHKMEFADSLSEMMVCDENPIETVEGLLKLNDDCLLHLFRFVSVADLGSIKSTCKRLRPLADQSFRLYRDKSLAIESCSMFADIWILKHFGKFIKSLNLDSFYERYASLDNILEIIAQFTGEELKSISFHECDKTNDESFECLKTLLKNVERIELKWLNYDYNVNSLLGYCENLKEVNIDGELMKLNSDWCSKNSNVTTLTISGLQDDGIVEDICKTFTHLESLSLDCIDTETNKMIHLSRLSHLRKLRLDTSNIDRILQHFTDKTVLQDLCLTYQGMNRSLASVLGKFPNLSNLTFQNCVGFDDEVVQHILSEKLVNIETLIFEECEEITFKSIKKIIKNLLDLKTLSVNGCSEVEFIDRDDYLSLRKMRNLQIFLDWRVYERTCEIIGNNLLDNVQVKRHQ